MRFSILTIIVLVWLFTATSHQPDLGLPYHFDRDEKIFLIVGGLYFFWIGLVVYVLGTILAGILRWARKQ